MVLPLIPLVLIAAGSLAGGGGIALGGKGAIDLKKANHDLGVAREAYQRRRECSEVRISQTNQMIVGFGDLQKGALTDVVLRMVQFLRRHEKQVRESDRLIADGMDAGTNAFVGPGGMDLNPSDWIAGLLGSIGVGAGTSAGMFTVAGMGTASTGAAISGLSGVAAESAMLAWMGGGALAAGGGGMALGAVALNFITLGPGLLVGGCVVMGQGQKAVTKAKKFKTEVEVAIAAFDETDARLDAIDQRVAEMSTVLVQLVELAVVALDELESEPFEPAQHAERFQRSLTLTRAVRDVSTAQILDEAGDMTDSSSFMVVKYKVMAEQATERAAAGVGAQK